MGPVQRRLNADDKRLCWKRWHEGASLSAIGREIGVSAPSVYGLFRKYGGIEPVERKRRSSALTLSEREDIATYLAEGWSVRTMAGFLGRSPSTVSREINRNGGPESYKASIAEAAAWKRAERPKKCVLLENRKLANVVGRKLAKRWSPQQISGWLLRQYPDNEEMRVSHETIYRTLYIQARGALKVELKDYLRTKRRFRQSRSNNRGAPRGQIRDAVPITDRPADVEDRSVPGHWEGDLIKGCNNSYIATVVERKTRFLLLVKTESAKTEAVVKALTKHMKNLPDELGKSLTWDRGVELANHSQFTVATNIDVYFCDPRSPWQRGSNENTNGLLRQYFPKGTDLREHSQAELNKVARELNERPRKTLGYLSPAECYNKLLR